MQFHWHQIGDDLVVYISGSLNWNSEFQQLYRQFQGELRRFMWAASGWVIVDLSEASAVDPRCAHTILEIVTPLKEMERVALRGRDSAIASLFADVGIPWVVEEQSSATEAADQTDAQPSEPWSSIFESLSDEEQGSDSPWASSAAKIGQVIDSLDASDSGGRKPSPGEGDRPLEEDENPVLWFSDGEDQPIVQGPGSVAIPKQRSSNAPSRPTPSPTEAEVFDWFFSIGQKAVDQEFGESSAPLQHSDEELSDRQLEGDSLFRGDSLLESGSVDDWCSPAKNERSAVGDEGQPEPLRPEAPHCSPAETNDMGRAVEVDQSVTGSEFEIDLELENLYLSKNPSQRDQEGKVGPVQFSANWQSLQPGSTFVRSEKKSRDYPDPVDLLGGATKDDSKPLSSGQGNQSHRKPTTSGYGYSQPPHPISHASGKGDGDFALPEAVGDRDRSESASQFLEMLAHAAGTRPRSASNVAAANDAVRQGIADFLAEFETASREKSELMTATKRLSGEILEAREKIARLNAQILAFEKKQQESPAREAEMPGWQLALSQAPLDSQVLRNRFKSAMKRFHASGMVEPDRILEEIELFHHGSGSIAVSLATQIDRARSEAGDGWRPMLLLASTLVREGAEEARRKRAIRVGWLASLVRNSPGRDRREINFVAAPVIRLLKSPAYRFSEEPKVEFNAREIERDLALWYACVRTDERQHLASDRWRMAIVRTLEKYESDRAVRSGIARLVEAHSLYLPGSWVELNSGEVGVVLASTPARPEYPQVLVMFQREGRSLVGIDPHWVRTSENANSGVLRGLRNPCLSELGRNSPMIDTGGSVVLPKMK